MNVELLQQVKQRILAEPDAFRMDKWTCGTAHCIAGWALLLNDIPIENPDAIAIAQTTVSGESPSMVAAELLDLSWPQQRRLFYVSNWPDAFIDRHYDAVAIGDRAAAAKHAARRIDRFIATGGDE